MMIEESMNNTLNAYKDEILEDGSYMIEQELSEHPEWLLNSQTNEKAVKEEW